MRHLTILFCTLFFISCKSKTAGEAEPGEKRLMLPPAPTSVATVKQWITDKNFVTIKAGLINEPGKGIPYEFVEETDTSAFASAFLEKEMSFKLYCNRDSTGVLFYGKLPSFDSTGKSIYIPDLADMIYQVEEVKPDILLRVTEERRNNFDGRMEKLGSIYKVLGADEKSLLLEAPRSYLDKPVVVLMEVREKNLNDK
ncbi:MAG TPA: hypothetical protein VGO58_00630 [Chitinophagaceae bacterium]|jgi:hypothetical protein|nr:hypothetical protein [Chitinophagaceae bacterium]